MDPDFNDPLLETNLAQAVLSVQPSTVEEGEEFNVRLYLKNLMTDQSLWNPRVHLDFGHALEQSSDGKGSNKGLSYRLGPVRYM